MRWWKPEAVWHGLAFFALSACGSDDKQQQACTDASTYKDDILKQKAADVAAGTLTELSSPCALTDAEKAKLGPSLTADYATACGKYSQAAATCKG